MPLRSMTGFGAEALGDLRVEIRSINSRYLELKIRQPFGPTVETRLRAQVKARLGRGRVDVLLVRDEATQEAERDEEQLRELLFRVREVQRLAAEQQVELSRPTALELLSFISRGRGPDSARPEPGDGWERAIEGALDALVEMRETEGAALEEVLGGFAAELEGIVAEVAAGSEGEGERLAASLRERVEAAMPAEARETLDPNRLAHEVALLVQRGDIREELDRIASHLEQWRAVLAEPAAAGQGKRLDFLSQELLREVTTIGSKISAHRGSASIIEAKAVVERMREQVQNVE